MAAEYMYLCIFKPHDFMLSFLAKHVFVIIEILWSGSYFQMPKTL